MKIYQKGVTQQAMPQRIQLITKNKTHGNGIKIEIQNGRPALTFDF